LQWNGDWVEVPSVEKRAYDSLKGEIGRGFKAGLRKKPGGTKLLGEGVGLPECPPTRVLSSSSRHWGKS